MAEVVAEAMAEVEAEVDCLLVHLEHIHLHTDRIPWGSVAVPSL